MKIFTERSIQEVKNSTIDEIIEEKNKYNNLVEFVLSFVGKESLEVEDSLLWKSAITQERMNVLSPFVHQAFEELLEMNTSNTSNTSNQWLLID